MIYTNQKKRELNKALMSKLDLGQYKETGGGIYLYVGQLPKGCEEITSESHLRRIVPEDIRPWNNVIPIFIEDNDKGWAVAYANCSESSIEKISEKLNAHRIYYLPGLAIRKGGNNG